ncbi:unnamed protein product [Schistocephalus solidus]|uniref:Uncharacterized protein n=1 Tax=Schistocephalus solidus TaxID=70667 RepID=A0A3P7CFE8_SCHSO|nr:unnamed protein product [Schistocephalus solidus]
MFTDNKNLWKVVDNTADEDHLQLNLNRFEDWSKGWLMPFNIRSMDASTSPVTVVAAWNDLPADVVLSTTANSFERKLDAYQTF